MRRTSILLAVGLILGVVLVGGCRARPDVTPGAPPPTPLVRVGSEEDDQAQDEALMELASRFPLAARQAEGVALDDSQCIDCHTDEEAVKALAVEPEEGEELSEGEG